MDASDSSGYVIPRYRAGPDTAFFHFLHGTVPGHQIDFMYCPEVPQGPLRQTHFGHLSRLIKYIEPRGSSAYAFAIGNLSRDDVQHEPGHGGLAILFALRVPGVTDHAGRDMPPYAHGIVAVDRSLEYVQILESITVLYLRFLEREGAEDRRGDFYRAYVRTFSEEPERVESFLANAIDEITDLPKPRRSNLPFDYEADPDHPAPTQIAIVHDDDEQFGKLADCAATLAAALYRSNLKWTSITTGREIDIVGGSTVRFIARSEASNLGRAIVHDLDSLPSKEDELVKLLFHAKQRVEHAPAPRQGWREKRAAQRPALRSDPPPGLHPSSTDSGDSGDAVDVEIDDAAATLVAGFEADPNASPPPVGGSPPKSTQSPAFDPRKSSPSKGMSAGRIPTPTGLSFDARRSSPVGGISAAVLHGATSGSSNFDARRSSPVNGVRAAAVPTITPSAVEDRPVIQSTPPPRAPIPSTHPPPLSAPQAETHLEREPPVREKKGKWIVALVAIAALVVIVVVSVGAGMSIQEGPGTEGTTSLPSTNVTGAAQPGGTTNPAPPPAQLTSTSTVSPPAGSAADTAAPAQSSSAGASNSSTKKGSGKSGKQGSKTSSTTNPFGGETKF
ncbi:MAG: hypothetical protein IPK82_10470 [Polyangiaceae bacterium]|nr:hypothetical protein [Polyangiaceae bacterium]